MIVTAHRPQASPPSAPFAGERGATLMLTLATFTLASILFAALATFSQGYLQSGAGFQSRTDRLQTHTDAVEYALNAVRNDNAIGRAGSSSTWTYGGVAVTCTGDPGSGAVSGSGRTDRLVTCKTSQVSAQIRYFDRGGSGSGVVSEVLAWKLLA